MSYSSMFKSAAVLLSTLLLTACMSLGQLSYKQAHMLKKEGFTLTEEGWTLRLPENLLFDFNEYKIKAQQIDELARISTKLQRYDLEKIKVIGHTDSIGDKAYNQTLSEKRADSVAQIFLGHGFRPSNTQIIGRGMTQPLVANDSEENRAINRRVNIVIVP